MDGSMHEWIHDTWNDYGQAQGWVHDTWNDGWINARIDAWFERESINGWTYGWMHGQMEGWMHGWMDERMDGWLDV